MNTDFWNIIHDGGIDAISGSIPGDIILTVGIEYLCEQLPTNSKTLQAKLVGCTIFSYTPFWKTSITELHAIAACDLEVLSAVTREDRIAVCCRDGMLELAYQAIEVCLVEGIAVTQSELEAAANRSVAQCHERNAKK